MGTVASYPEYCQAEWMLQKDFKDAEGRSKKIRGGAEGNIQARPERTREAEVREMGQQGRLCEHRTEAMMEDTVLPGEE